MRSLPVRRRHVRGGSVFLDARSLLFREAARVVVDPALDANVVLHLLKGLIELQGRRGGGLRRCHVGTGVGERRERADLVQRVGD